MGTKGRTYIDVRVLLENPTSRYNSGTSIKVENGATVKFYKPGDYLQVQCKSVTSVQLWKLRHFWKVQVVPWNAVQVQNIVQHFNWKLSSTFLQNVPTFRPHISSLSCQNSDRVDLAWLTFQDFHELRRQLLFRVAGCVFTVRKAHDEKLKTEVTP